MTLINLTSRLPVEAVNEDYDLIMRDTVTDGSHYTTVWLRKDKETIVKVYTHVPSIVEVKEDYLEHKEKHV